MSYSADKFGCTKLANRAFERRLNDDEVVLHFLLTEVNSSKFGPRISQKLSELGYSESLILNPDIHSARENAQRMQVMDYRYYSSRQEDNQRNLFYGFPEFVEWGVVNTQTEEILSQVRYINDPVFWNKVTSGSRMAPDAVPVFNAALRGKPLPHGVELTRFLAVKNIIEADNFSALPAMIVVTDNQNVTNLEGHSRMTALAWATHGQPKKPFPVIVGRSSKMKEWRYF